MAHPAIALMTPMPLLKTAADQQTQAAQLSRAIPEPMKKEQDHTIQALHRIILLTKKVMNQHPAEAMIRMRTKVEETKIHPVMMDSQRTIRKDRNKNRIREDKMNLQKTEAEVMISQRMKPLNHPIRQDTNAGKNQARKSQGEKNPGELNPAEKNLAVLNRAKRNHAEWSHVVKNQEELNPAEKNPEAVTVLLQVAVTTAVEEVIQEVHHRHHPEVEEDNFN